MYSFYYLVPICFGTVAILKKLTQRLHQNIGRFQPFIGHEGPQGEQSYSSTLFLTSALEVVRGQCHALAAPYPRERLSTHYTGGWVGLRACLDRCGKFRPHRDSISGPSSTQAVSIPTALPGPPSKHRAILFLCISQYAAICPETFSSSVDGEWQRHAGDTSSDVPPMRI